MNSFKRGSSIAMRFVLAALAVGVGTTAWAGPGAFSYEGRLYQSDGVTPVVGSVTFRMEIVAPNNCVLRVETVTKILTAAEGGAFSIDVGIDSQRVSPDPGLSLQQAYANSGAPLTGVSGCTYAAVASDNRNLRITANGELMSPNIAINSVPYATVAESLNGRTENNFIQVNANVTQARLDVLASGTSPDYVRTTANAGSALPIYSGDPTSPMNGSIWFDSVAGVVKYRNAGGTQTVGSGGGGTVMSVMTGAGLTGGPITTAGSIEIAPNGVTNAMIANEAVNTAKIQNLSVTGAKIAVGAIDQTHLVSNINISTSGNVSSATVTTRQIQLFDPDASSVNKITFTADPTLNADYTLRWPLSAGFPNQVLTTDGLGNLSWTNSSPAVSGPFGSVLVNGGGTIAGANNLFWDEANSRLVIGPQVAAPAAPLHIFNSAAQIVLQDTDTVNASGIVANVKFKDSANLDAGFIGFGGTSDLKILNSGNSPTTFWINGFERMRISDAGYVGIGTTTPSQRLTVAGNIAPSATNTHDLGTPSVLFKDAYVTNGVTVTSDLRKKTNIEDSDLGLAFVNDLRPVSYYWKEGDKNLHYGVIAQEAEQALTHAKTRSGRASEVDNVIVTHDEKTDAYGVRYTELIAPIIKAIQELYAELSSQSRRIASVKAEGDARTAKLEIENQKLKQENADMKARLERIERLLE